MYEVIQVRLREAGKITYFSTSGMKFKTGDIVIVEADRAEELGSRLMESGETVHVVGRIEKGSRTVRLLG